MRENFDLHLSQYFLEHVNSGGRNYGSRKHIPVFHESHLKGQFSSQGIAKGLRVYVYKEWRAWGRTSPQKSVAIRIKIVGIVFA